MEFFILFALFRYVQFIPILPMLRSKLLRRYMNIKNILTKQILCKYYFVGLNKNFMKGLCRD